MFNIVNLNYESNIKDWLLKEENVYVGRANPSYGLSQSKWANPFTLRHYNDRALVIELYKRHLLQNTHLTETINELKGKVLGCWCSPENCHAEFLHLLAGNVPRYKMAHNHNLRKSAESKPPMSPKPILTKQIKLNNTQLQEKVEMLEAQLRDVMEDSKQKDARLKKLEDRVTQLEADELKNASYLAVQKNVSNLLSNRVSQLEQYTRRYSVVVSGIKKNPKESREIVREEISTLLQEAGSTTTVNDIDKCHRNGPPFGEFQDIIVRFKSHEAKEAFYRKRKSITRPNVRVKPSLSNANYNLLKDAKEQIKCFTSNPENFDNPPEFVFANIHGDLQIKSAKNTAENNMFYTFNSLQSLFEIVYKHNNQIANQLSDKDLGYYDDPKAVFHRPKEELDAKDRAYAEAKAAAKTKAAAKAEAAAVAEAGAEAEPSAVTVLNVDSTSTPSVSVTKS